MPNNKNKKSIPKTKAEINEAVLNRIINKGGDAIAKTMVGKPQSRIDSNMPKPLTKEQYDRRQAGEISGKSLGVGGPEAKARRIEELKSQMDPSVRSGMGPLQDPKAREREQVAAYIHKKTAEKRRMGVSKINAETGKIAKQVAGERIMGQVEKKIKKQTEKQVEGQIERGLNMKQKFAVRIAAAIAGQEAINALNAVAKKMAEKAEGGGVGGAAIIGVTYIMALIKDISDVPASLIPSMGFLTGIIFGTIVSLFWLMVCGNKHGFVDKFAIKILLKILICIFLDGIPVLGILPIMLVTNVWNHWDYHKEKEKARKGLVEIEMERERVIHRAQMAAYDV